METASAQTASAQADGVTSSISATVYNTSTIQSDEIGNIIDVDGMEFFWEGRQLQGAGENGTPYIRYEYNIDGQRTKKILQYPGLDTPITTEYFYNSGMLMGQKTGDDVLQFMYDESGDMFGFTYNGTPYYYVKNAQNDVWAVTNADGQAVVLYFYDAWGDVAKRYVADGYDTIAQINPILYRSYYCDLELGFYYLNTRYYAPTLHRFLNADSAIGQVGNVEGANMFVYAFNNPIIYSDPTGNWPKLSTVLAVVACTAAVVAVVAATVATCGAAAPALAIAGGGVIGSMTAGAIATATSVATGAMLVAGVSAVAAVTSAVVEKGTDRVNKRNNSVYVLKDSSGTVQYVGRTNNVDKRASAHRANPARASLEMEVIASGLTLQEARALEQASMAYHHTINTANKMNNQINSIAPKYWSAYKELALGALRYEWNQVSNEILYWTGN